MTDKPTPKTFIPALIIFFLFSFYSTALHAQKEKGSGKYELGMNLGALIYQGDLTPSDLGSYRTMKPVIGIYGSRILTQAFSVRLNLAFGRLKGDESKYSEPEYRQQRNFAFTSPVTEVSGLLVWNVLGLKPNAAGIINFTPYVFAGAGYSFIKVKRDYSRFNASHFGNTSEVVTGLDEDIAVTPPRGIPVIPIGLGVRYGISPKLSFTLESTYRHTFTDYLDGFSRAANPALKDSYHSHTAGLIYSFGNKNKLDCPPVKL
jgi:Domain of unknown function (DUF6089)